MANVKDLIEELKDNTEFIIVARDKGDKVVVNGRGNLVDILACVSAIVETFAEESEMSVEEAMEILREAIEFTHMDGGDSNGILN